MRIDSATAPNVLPSASRMNAWTSWAISGVAVRPVPIAQEVHAFIREALGSTLGAVAESIRIQYGGSVNPENAASLMAQPDIDGALVGGASLDPDSFAELIHLVAQSAKAGAA